MQITIDGPFWITMACIYAAVVGVNIILKLREIKLTQRQIDLMERK